MSRGKIAVAMSEASREYAEGQRIKSRYCDFSMARKKGLFPCEQKCNQCIACIEVTVNGDRKHFSLLKSRGAQR